MTISSAPKKLALLDLLNGQPSRGVPSITAAAQANGFHVDRFDVRQHKEIPKLTEYDVFVSSGGPGDPRDMGQETNQWGDAYGQFLDDLLTHNETHPDCPKKLFLICHSFQVACMHWGLGVATPREQNKALMGVHPQHKHPDLTEAQYASLPQAWQRLLRGLLQEDPFWTLESRLYQILPNTEHRPDFKFLTAHSNLAVTSMIHESGHIMGTQFHVEATPETITDVFDSPESAKILSELYDANTLQMMRGHIPQTNSAHHLFLDFLKAA